MPHLFQLTQYAESGGLSVYESTTPTRTLDLTNRTGAGTGYIDLLDYHPVNAELDPVSLQRTPAGLGADVPMVGYRNAVESAKILIVGSAETPLRLQVNTLLSYQQAVHDWGRYPSGSFQSGPVYLELRIKNTGTQLRSRLKTMRVDLDEGALDFGQWGTKKVQATLYFEREPFWESVAWTTPNLFSMAAGGTSPLTLVNDPASGGQSFYFASGSAPAGQLPTPAELTVKYLGDGAGLTDPGDGMARVWAGTILGSAGASHAMQGEAFNASESSGVASAASGAASGGNYANCTGASGRVVWQVPTAWSQTMRGWNRLLVRQLAAPIAGGNLRMRAKWAIFGLQDLWAGDWLTFPSGVGEVEGDIVDFGAIPVPPDPRIPNQGQNLHLVIEWAGSAAPFGIDYLVILGMRSYANYRYLGFSMDVNSALYAYDEQAYDITLPGGPYYTKVIRTVGGPLYLLPGVANHVGVIVENDTGHAYITRRYSVAVRYRSRYLLVPDA